MNTDSCQIKSRFRPMQARSNEFRKFGLAGNRLEAATPLGLVILGAFTQGSSFVATLGFGAESLRDSGSEFPKGIEARSLIGASDFPALKDFRICVHLCPSVVKVWSNCILPAYFASGRNHADSLLLKPLVVSMAKSASVAALRSTVPACSAEITPMFQPAAYTPMISHAA